MLTFPFGVSASEGKFDGVLLAGRVSQLDEVANGTVGGSRVDDAAVTFMHEVFCNFVVLNDRHMLVAIIASINSDVFISVTMQVVVGWEAATNDWSIGHFGGSVDSLEQI
jgi:hypothetical protein